MTGSIPTRRTLHACPADFGTPSLTMKRPAMTTTERPAFDICGELPGAGTTLLEASAGTGKTYAFAALFTRFVAEGVDLAEILAVTFTRMATGELRDRVRSRLVSAEEALGRYLESGLSPDASDKLLTHLVKGKSAEVATRRERLADALAT